MRLKNMIIISVMRVFRVEVGILKNRIPTSYDNNETILFQLGLKVGYMKCLIDIWGF